MSSVADHGESASPLDKYREEGREAAHRGVPAILNPYPIALLHGLEWRRGHDEVSQELADA